MPSRSIFSHNAQVQTVTTGALYTDASLAGATDRHLNCTECHHHSSPFWGLTGNTGRVCKGVGTLIHNVIYLQFKRRKGKETKQPFVANTFQHDKYIFISFTEWFATWQQTLCVRAWLLIQKVKNIYIYIYMYMYVYIHRYVYVYIYIKQKFNYSNICYSVIKSVIYKNEMTGFCLPLRHFKLTPWNWCLYKALPHVIQSHDTVHF